MAVSPTAKPDDIHLIFVQSGRLQDVAKSALQAKSVVVGLTSGSVINGDHGRDTPLV